MYPIINIFGREIGTYSICTIIGLLISGFVAYKLGKTKGFTVEDIVFVMLSIVAGILIGGHLLYGITNYKYVVALFENISQLSFKQIINVLSVVFGGSVFYGGFLGAMVALRIYSAKGGKERRRSIFDIYAVCIPLFHCFGRIGCFLGGCCYGIESKYGFTVHNNQLVPDINDVSRVPVALIEAYGNLLIFLLLLKLFNKQKLKGRMMYLYMLLYPVLRFGTEFLRGDEIRGMWFGFSTSQWISAALFVIAFFYILFHIKSFFKDLFARGDGSLPTNKNIFKAIALWVLTFGIYGIVVMTSVSKNINRTATPYDKKKTMNHCLLVFLVGWLTFGIGYLVWYYRLSKRVEKELLRRNIDYLFTKNDFWLWNVLGIIVIVGPLVYLHKLFSAINLINADYNNNEKTA